MDILIWLYLFVLGACFGSFAGAMAWRIEKGKKVVRERSECEHCHHKLSALDLIPVLSWLGLRGKCRYCKKPIGYSALLLELGLGLAFVVSYLAWPFALTDPLSWTVFGLWLAALVLLSILVVYDIRHFILPDVVIWPLAGAGLMIFVLRAIEQHSGLPEVVVQVALALLPITGLYGLLYAVSRGKWVGFGDVKLGLFIGLALGWQAALLSVLLANLIGTLWILPGMVLGRIKRTSRIPFGPFLIAGAFIAFLWGQTLWVYYVSLLRG